MTFLNLIRYKNLLILALTQVMVRYFLLAKKIFFIDDNFWLLLIATISIAAAGYIINDYFDVKIDIINKPKAVIVGDKIKRRTAIFLHQLFNMIGLFVGLMLGKTIFFLNLLSITLLWFYSERYKKKAFVGNLMIAFLAGLSLMIVAVFYDTAYQLIGVYAFFAFLVTLIREITKDVQDINGDKQNACRTLPIIWGIKKTKILLYCLIAIFAFSLLIVAQFTKKQEILIMLALLLISVLLLVYRLIAANNAKDFDFLSQLCKIMMLLGIGSMAVI